MKILFDGQIFINQRFGGVSRYFSEIIKILRKDLHIDLPLLIHRNEYVKYSFELSNKTIDISRINFKGHHHILKIANFINKEYTKKILKQNNFDIFHPTWYDPYFLKLCNKPIVTTIHDLVHEKYRNDGNEVINHKKRSIEIATKIIAVSEYTKQTIIDAYDINPDNIDVVYHGGPLKMSKNSYLSNRWGNYILYVGRRNDYKNFYMFLKGVTNILVENATYNLVCVGNDLNEDEIKFAENLGIRHRIKTFHSSDKELYSLYHHAKVFVFPSKFEGFGIPILEAMKNGCPCSLSETTCFPEIAQNAASYFDPDDSKSIYESIKKIISDDIYRNSLVDLGSKRVKHFSWDKAAFDTKNVYESILNLK